MLQFVIFDLDDTLLDFQADEAASLTTILTRYQVPDLAVAKRTYQAHNQRVWQKIERGADRTNLLNQRFQLVLGQLGIAVDGPAVQREYDHLLGQGFQTLPGAAALLTHLRQAGLTLLVGTNGVHDTQLSRLQGAGLAPDFDHVFISETVGYAKPDRRFFDAIFHAYPTLTTANTVMVGDSIRSDVIGAHNAGLPAIWFNPHQVQDTSGVLPDATATNFDELGRQLLAWPNRQAH